MLKAFFIEDIFECTQENLVKLKEIIITRPQSIVFLIGELASGKTTMLKWMFGDFVDSPSFVLQNEYKVDIGDKILRISHWDLYRVNEVPREIYFDDADVVAIEWPNKFDELYFRLKPDFIIYLTPQHQVYAFSSKNIQ